jgi:deazaflavin-dependent oxidoreductase (nitroreductase family)
VVPELVRRPLLRIAGTRAGSRGVRWALPRLDRLVSRVTKGRLTFTQMVLPTLFLTTTGRRSGTPRAHPLVYLTEGDAWAVVGSNWGRRTHPAWTHNLLADPHASVLLHGTRTRVRAELVTGDDRERIYERFAGLAPAYPRYRRSAGDRQIRVFLLHPTTDAQPEGDPA